MTTDATGWPHHDKDCGLDTDHNGYCRPRRRIDPLDVAGPQRRIADTLDEPRHLTAPQPAPAEGTGLPIWPMVIEDMRERHSVGWTKYGTPLKAFNGRDALVDAYQEALDLCVYLRQAIAERNAA